MKKLLVIAMLSVVAFSVDAQQLKTPRKVENVTICDMSGDPVQLPGWGEKNLFIFYVDPDSYVGKNANKDFSAEIEENKRCSGSNLLGFGIINTADTKLPKWIVRDMARKRVEKSGALSLDDQNNTLTKAWGLGNCDGAFAMIVVNKQGEIVYFRTSEITPAEKEEFYKFIEAYK